MAEATKTCIHCSAEMPADSPECTDCGQDFDPSPGYRSAVNGFRAWAVVASGANRGSQTVDFKRPLMPQMVR